MFENNKNFLLDIFFPKFCLGCNKEGGYLCADCRAIIEVSNCHQRNRTKYLSDLYFSLPYRKALVKKMIWFFKYEPLVKELSKTLSSLIIEHLELIDQKPDFSGFRLIPIPLEDRKLKWRGFNQSEELAKELSESLKIPLIKEVLFKIKGTEDQVNLSDEERKENVRRVFVVKDESQIRDKKVLLVDDIYTTGATMEEAAKTLKEAGAKEIIGIVLARAEIGEDRI